MVDDITNRQLLAALTGRFESRFDSIEHKFDSLEALVAGIGDTVAGIANNMATSGELREFREELHNDIDSVELRLGRRIDTAFLGKSAH
jgi:hypothetical protein